MKQKILSFCLISCFLFTSLNAQERNERDKSPEIPERVNLKKNNTKADNVLNATPACNTNTTICIGGVAGPFPFVVAPKEFSTTTCQTGGTNVNGFGYILLNIATSGPLNLLVDGDSNMGFIDYIIYNIPAGVSPCVAIQNPANEIACNYASASSGCTQFGTNFSCLSTRPAPFVTAGSQVMLIVHDYNGYSSTFTLQLGPLPGAQTGPPNSTINSLPPICSNAAPVQLTADTNGGTWSGTGVSASGMFNPAVAGVGTHTISYSIGVAPCNSSSTQTFQVIQAPVANASSNAGSIAFGQTLQLAGTPVTNATYGWTGPGGWTSILQNPTRPTVSASENGNYTLTVTLPNLCKATSTISVNVSNGVPLTVMTSKNDNVCYQDANGEATVTVVTGTPPYTYIWNTTPVQTTSTATNLTAGTYTVIVKDALNKTATATVTVTEPAQMTVAVTGNEAGICAGSTATLTATGANDYNWFATASAVTPIFTGPVFSTTPSGTATYYVEGEGVAVEQTTKLETQIDVLTGTTGGNGCMFNVTAASDVTISGFDVYVGSSGTQATLQVYYRIGNSQGFELSNAGWTLLGSTVLPTTPGSGYLATISVINLPIPAGQTYGIYITATTQNSGYIAYTSGSNSYTDGTLTLNSGNGVAYPFSSSFGPKIWNGRIHYKKPEYCAGPRIPVTVNVNPLAILNIVGTNVTCNGANNGKATVTATGTAPFSYSWNTVPVQNTATATGLAPGTYTVKVKDGNNCEVTKSIIITEPTAMVALISSSTNASCGTTPNGQATATNTGGTAPYTYSWNTVPVQTTATANGLAPGNYIVTVKDAKNCQTTASVTINANDTVVPVAITQNKIIQLDVTGNATIAVSDINNGSSDICSINTMTLNKTNFNCTNLGNNTVILTVTDFAGNTSTATAIVTVQDTINPMVITQNFTVQLDATGNATIAVADINNGSSDNCAIATLVLDTTSFNCTNIGTNTVTLTATDSSGNISTGTAIVTVEDAVNPTVITQNITVNLDASGTATITASQIDNSSSDDCGIQTFTLDITSFNCANVGPNTVTLTATDFSGNTSTGTATVTVVNNFPPTIITQNITIPLNSSGTASIVTTDIVVNSGSNCGVQSVVLDITDFDCTNIGANTVTVTVTDNNGNSSTGTAIVTVQDVINPTVITQNFTVQLDATGNATITVSDINNGSSDNCSIDTLVLDVTSFYCTNIGTNTVTLTATDSSGNSSTGTAIVTVEDAVNPTVITQNITVNLDASGTATITASQIDNSSSDDCGIETMVLDITSFNCTNVGPNTVTLTATDFSGNISTGTAIVTVVNNFPPTIITQNITIPLNSSGTASIVTTDIVVNSGSNCGVQSVVLDITDFDCTNIGANTVTVTMTDNNGNTSTATAIVTVQDTTNPTVITQNFTVQLDATGNATIAVSDIDNGSSDNCSIDTLVLDVTSFNCTNIGTNTVTLTATDSSGNTSTGTAIVTVEDSVNPTVITQNITVNLDASGTATITASQIDNGSSDDCGIQTMVLDTTTFNCNNVGPNTVTFTATDFSGNISTGTAIVTVVNNFPPTIITQNITIPLNSTGTASIVSSDIVVSAVSNCGVQSVVLDVTNFNCTNIGANTVAVTVTDNNGNSSTATAIVTVQDTTNPTVITQNFTVQLDATGNATIAVSDINNGSFDNCGITLVLDTTTFNCTNIGPNTVTLTATDSSGNSSTGTAIVTVQDAVNPTVNTQNITVNLDASGTATITASQIDNSSSDDCGIQTFALDITTFNCTNVGPNTVTLTATDFSGNISTGTAIVTVVNNLPPTIITQNITIPLNSSGTASIVTTDIVVNSGSNCGVQSVVLDITDFDCTNIGANTVTVTMTDNNGNTSTATAIVTVQDDINPTVITQNFTVQLDASGNATIAVSDINNGSFDNCGITLVLDVTNFNCTNIGTNTVTLTATDSSGNSSTGTAIVTVEDAVNPTVNTQNITVNLDASGTATITASQIDNSSFDDCGIQTFTLDITSFNCTNVGPNTVTLTATDFSGNISTGTAIVTVEDAVNPTVITQNITVNLDASGTATITASQIDNGSSDDCGIQTMVLDITSFNCTNVGTNTVTLTATDFSGNSSTGTAIVTVEDSVNPNVITQNITVNLDASGTATITASQIDNGSSDDCGIQTMVLDTTTFNCTNVGPNTVTLTATDFSGNTSTGTAIVTVVNNLPPIITQNITIPLNSSGTASIVTTDIVVNSGSNCGVQSVVLDVTNFNCTNIGANTVTVTMTDNNGNTSTATAIVTVQDTINPTVITQNFTVQLDATGNATIAVSDIDNGSFDNCGITLGLDVTSFNCTNLGTNTVTLTATDSSGNISTGTAIVSVQDAVNPNVITQNITVNLDASGTATITASQIDNGSSDDCGIETMVLDTTTFNCTNVGPNTVTLTATDFSGNTSTGTAIVTVVNNFPPTIITQNITIPLNSSGTASIVTTDIVVNSGSNCGVQSVVLDITDFNCTSIGANTVTVTMTDNNGNASTATAIVTVQDTTNPTVITQNFTVQLDATGNATIAVSDIDNGSFDNCGITLVLDVTNFNCTNLGTNTVTLTATDSSGNTSTGTAIVSVVDNLGPIITSQPAIINLDSNGVATLSVTDVVVSVTDNCGVASTVISETDFDCSEIGNNTIQITSTDNNGNISQQSVSVTIQDTIPPVAITQNIQVSLSQNGTFTLTPAMVNNNSTDNCSIASMNVNITNFGCNQIGANTVILTVTDTFGNTNTATAIVTILPIPEPTVTSLTQEFCAIDEPIIADIAVESGLVQWFANATGGTPLSNAASLISGTYYVATQSGNCYSSRVAVNIIVKDPPAPTGDALQYICREQEFTIASLLTNEEEILWYDSPSGGTPLSSSTVLEHQQKYYASQIIGDCESTNRLEVEVEIRYCDVVIYNSVSANGDGKNDYFKIEGMSYFPDNSVEIFNQWGQIVYKTSQYGEASGNYFKGIANTGLGINANGQTLLPFGTYYYVIQFLNHDKQRMQKTGYLHLNH